jgi:hypothetical protein
MQNRIQLATTGALMNILKRLQSVLPRCAAALGAMVVLSVTALTAPSHAISTTERNVLTALYTSTAGANWFNKTNWNDGTGTECTWAGVTCNGGNANVIGITLPGNNLVGTLPSTLKNLTALQTLIINDNKIGGSIPSLTGMTALQTFHLYGNQLSGALPSLSGLVALQSFNVSNNQLTGSISTYAGLNALQSYLVGDNLLTGTIPSMSGYPALQRFGADGNALTGSIPTFSGLTGLRDVFLANNQLTGGIPALASFTQLRSFVAYNNQLTGSIPSLSGLASLQDFSVFNNQLIGVLPSLAGLSQLQYFRVEQNQLSGPVPAVPSPVNALQPGGSGLCFNRLSPSVNTAWDAATGSTPWSAGCVPPYIVTQTTTLPFGGVTINTPSDTLNVVLTNTSVDAGTVTNCTFSGTHAAQFAFNPAITFPIALPASQALNLPVRVTATSVGAKTATLTCTLGAGGSMSGGPTALSAFAGLGCLDADGDGDIDPATDIVIHARAALGFTGAQVTNGAITGTPPRNTWPLIRAYLNAHCGTNYAP